MIIASEALARILEVGLAKRLGSEVCSLQDLPGRILEEDLRSKEPAPAWDNSAMDGFAVVAQYLQSASMEKPMRLRVTDSISAGDSGQVRSKEGDLLETAVEIMTGAPLPEGPWDAVIKIEEVELVRNAQGPVTDILVSKSISQGENIRKKGEDFALGQLVATRGMEVTPDLILAMAGLGLHEARVARRPRVAVISTGRELTGPEVPTLAPGMIRNSTAPYLMAALPRLGVEARWYGTIADEPGAFQELISKVLRDRPDVILTTGAVSMGKHDFVRPALEQLGARVHFHKMAIRPGKPLLFAEFSDGPVVFGVPGNPISTAVGLRFFLTPYFRVLQGLAPEVPLRARLSKPTQKPDGLRCYFKARVELKDDGAWVESLPGQGSALVGPLLRANAWVELPEEGRQVSSGEWVSVHPFFPMEKPWSFEKGSNSPARNAHLDSKAAKMSHGVQAQDSEKGCCHS